jgi:hypothetical protein
MILPAKSVTTFLNVDIDLRSKSGISELLGYLGPSVIVLHDAAHEASFELNKMHSSLDEALLNIVELIRSLPQQAQAIWNQCEFRKANIGIQAGTEPYEAHYEISNKVVALLASAQIEITFSVYAARLTPG